MGHRAQVPDQQESAYLFSPFLLLKQALKKLELKSIGHRQRGGGEMRPRDCPNWRRISFLQPFN